MWIFLTKHLPELFLTCPEVWTQIEYTDIRPAIINRKDHEPNAVKIQGRSDLKGAGYLNINNIIFENDEIANHYQNYNKIIWKEPTSYQCYYFYVEFF